MNHAIIKAVTIAGSQYKLATSLGVSQALISQWVNGARIHTRHFSRIERETGVSAVDLLADELKKNDSMSTA